MFKNMLGRSSKTPFLGKTQAPKVNLTIPKKLTTTQSDVLGQATKDIARNIGNGIDIVKAINTVVPTNIELHVIDQADDGKIKKASFCGPNTNMENRLKGFNKETGEFDEIITQPINDLDRACLVHDIEYTKFKDKPRRQKADLVLKGVADDIFASSDATSVQRFNAGLVKIIMKGKQKLGVGLGGTFDPNSALEMRVAKQKFGGVFGVGTIPADPGLSSVAVGLLTLAASIGIPATIAIVNKLRKK